MKRMQVPEREEWFEACVRKDDGIVFFRFPLISLTFLFLELVHFHGPKEIDIQNFSITLEMTPEVWTKVQDWSGGAEIFVDTVTC